MFTRAAVKLSLFRMLLLELLYPTLLSINPPPPSLKIQKHDKNKFSDFIDVENYYN